MSKGKLIVFEGPDFSGKSTQIKLVKNELKNLKFNNFLYTREPGSHLPESSYYCEEVRNFILNNDLTPEQEAVLFAESRYEHTKEMIKYINDGFNILCDRYIISSFAYQGYAQNIGKEKIYELNRATIDLLKENQVSICAFKFDISKATWEERKAKRLQAESADSIESKNIHDKVFEFYNDMEIYNYFVSDLDINSYQINANGNINEIHESVFHQIKELIL